MYGFSRGGGHRYLKLQKAIRSCNNRRCQSDGGPGPRPASKSTEAKPPPPSDVAQPTPIWSRLGPVTKAFNGYGRAQEKKPYTTQVVTSIVIYFCGDLGAQKSGGEAYDPWRAARNMIIGATVSIPAYNWFIYLSGCFKYSSKLLSIGTKVVVNQIVFTPIFLSTFFSMQTLLSGDGPAEALDRVRRTVPASFVNALKLWPAVMAFSFAYIPLEWRALFAGGIAVFWQAYLSWLNQRAEREENIVMESGNK